VIEAAWFGDILTVVDTRTRAGTTYHRDLFSTQFGGGQANDTFAHRADWSPNCTICQVTA
jgi:hypothetical protein